MRSHAGALKTIELGSRTLFSSKKNHISACGSTEAAIFQARATAPGKPIEVEVEDMEELAQAFQAEANIVMLDNFSLEDMRGS